MEQPGKYLDEFDAILRSHDKKRLPLHLRLLDVRAVGVHVVVSRHSVSAINRGAAWPEGFAGDLQRGVFG